MGCVSSLLKGGVNEEKTQHNQLVTMRSLGVLGFMLS